MRISIRRFAEIVSRTLPITSPIYEFGSCQVPGQEKIANIRSFFQQSEYYGCDMMMGPGVDCILDLHNIQLPDETAGAVLAFETLEHVERPWIAMEEVYRILKPGGMVVTSVPMNFLIHAFPSDYWRFTPEGMRVLLAPFESSWVGYAGMKDFPYTVLGIGFKGAFPDMTDFLREYEHWKSRQPLPDLASQILPVGLIPSVRWIAGTMRALRRSSPVDPDR